MDCGIKVGDTVRIINDDGGDGPLELGCDYKVSAIQGVDKDYPIAVRYGNMNVSPKLGSFIMVSVEVRVVEKRVDDYYIELLESLLPEKIILAVRSLAYD